MNTKAISLAKIVKTYGSQKVLHGVDLDVAAGEFVSMLGPSGSGKTTLLKIIAGFEDPDSGDVSIGDRSMAGVPPEHRNIGVVFQNYSLFPHMDVATNIGFPLRMRKVSRNEQQKQVERVLSLVALDGYGKRMPNQLSGGQQQRVAIARAIVFEPDILLMDEPLGALDRRLRGDMQLEIKALHERLGITIVYVTHDQDEALSMSDRVVVFNRGGIEQVGTPSDVYRHPSTLFVADFLGDSLALTGKAGVDGVQIPGLATPVPIGSSGPHGDVKLLWRPDQVEVVSDAPDAAALDGGRLAVRANVLTAAYAGTALRLRVEIPGGDIGIVAAPDRASISAGETIGLMLPLDQVTILPVSQNTRLSGGKS
ncbi:MAG: ABC transporter ATP-binding protein [Rhizobiaceae bacterium]|nr:ABC transporter ATP-binding protein [Rhizobiaceae bacterium]